MAAPWARFADGSVRPLPPDCDCTTHEGPHWLHMDRLDREANRRRLAELREAPPSAWAVVALCDLAQAECRRLRERLRQMAARNIVEILPEEGTSDDPRG